MQSMSQIARIAHKHLVESITALKIFDKVDVDQHDDIRCQMKIPGKYNVEHLGENTVYIPSCVVRVCKNDVMVSGTASSEELRIPLEDPECFAKALKAAQQCRAGYDSDLFAQMIKCVSGVLEKYKPSLDALKKKVSGV